MKYNDTIDGIILQMDDCIAKRNKRYKIIDSDYKVPEGTPNAERLILSSDHDEYKRRRDNVKKRFDNDFITLEDRLDELCRAIRKKQPHLTDLTPDLLNNNGKVPGNIVFGRTRVSYKNFEAVVPHLLPFPVKHPILLSSDGDTEMLFSLIIRLMYTLPVGKLELNAFDPNYFGASLQKYNTLFTNKAISPFGKICSGKNELFEMLEKATGYAENLLQNVFAGSAGCTSWSEYNRNMYLSGQIGEILPYKVYFLCDVPDTMNSDCIDLLIRLSNVCERCGILLAMTVNEQHFSSQEEAHWDHNTKNMRAFLDKCPDINEMPVTVSDKKQLSCIELFSEKERFPENALFTTLTDAYISKLEENSKKGGGFYDLFNAAGFFCQSALNGIDAALGFLPEKRGEAVLTLGDRVPHVLIGGATGSGKSNLLHSFITNMCRRYSPDEVSLYLLDFKQGVEFNKYADPGVLSHAGLIATEADVEFGASVLIHLDSEIKKRYGLFKKSNCTQYSDYRKLNPDAVLPRIVVLIDEFQELFGTKNSPEIFSKMERIVKQGRAAGVHLVMATQTLSGLGNAGTPFSTIESQFGGRIALSCSAAESSRILGASTGAGNEAASKIKVPFAIINTSSGLASENVLFTVPKSDDYVAEVVKAISGEWSSRGRRTDTKLYNGDHLPEFPDTTAFCSDKFEILLGETADYNGDKLRIVLDDKNTENLLVCGRDKAMLPGLRKSVMLSADGCRAIDEIAVVGKNDFPAVQKNTVYYTGLKDFAAAYMNMSEDDLKNKRRLVIFNNRNPAAEVEFSSSAYPAPTTDEGKWFRNFMTSCASMGMHIAAFFDSQEEFKASGLTNEMFAHTAAFSITLKALCLLGSSGYPADGFIQSRRVVILKNGVQCSRIKPYVDPTGDDDE